jgi:hypothetical protein
MEVVMRDRRYAILLSPQDHSNERLNPVSRKKDSRNPAQKSFFLDKSARRGHVSEARGQRPEARGQEAEVRKQRSGSRGQEAEVRKQRSGSRDQEAEVRESKVRESEASETGFEWAISHHDGTSIMDGNELTSYSSLTSFLTGLCYIRSKLSAQRAISSMVSLGG